MRIKRLNTPDAAARNRMSFLDVTAGGFGAAIFLAVIFMSLPTENASGKLGSEQFLHLMVEWRALDVDDVDVLMELIVHTPQGDNVRLVERQESRQVISPFTGRVDVPSDEWLEVMMMGDSHFGDNALFDGNKRWLSLRIVAPCPALEDETGWSFDLAVRKAIPASYRMDRAKIQYSARLYTADSKQNGYHWTTGTMTMNGAEDSPLPYGQTGVELLWHPSTEDDNARAENRKIPVSARPADNLEHCQAAS